MNLPESVLSAKDVPFTVYVQEGKNCPWCERAKALLERREFPFTVVSQPLEEIRLTAARAHMTTVPIIYHGVKLIGGATDLQSYVATNFPLAI